MGVRQGGFVRATRVGAVIQSRDFCCGVGASPFSFSEYSHGLRRVPFLHADHRYDISIDHWVIVPRNGGMVVEGVLGRGALGWRVWIPHHWVWRRTDENIGMEERTMG